MTQEDDKLNSQFAINISIENLTINQKSDENQQQICFPLDLKHIKYWLIGIAAAVIGIIGFLIDFYFKLKLNL